MLVLGEAGLRSGSEALWLRFEDVDLEDGFLQVRSGRDGHRTKSGKGRWVPLTPRLRETLSDHLAELPDDFRAHDLRHRRVTTWLSAGHGTVNVQKAFGHSDLKTTTGYYTFVRSDLESLVEPQEAERRERAELKR